MNCNTTARRRPNAAYYPHVGNLINELFNTAVGDVVQKTDKKRFTNPATNVIEYDNRYELMLTLPGYSKEDVSITIEDERLTVKSIKTEEESDQSLNYRLREWNYGGVEKHFKLSDTIDTASVEAIFEQGILKITLAKKEEAIPQPPKSITIK